MIPIARHLPNKNRDQINSFFRAAIKEMIALREQQPASEVRRPLLGTRGIKQMPGINIVFCRSAAAISCS